MSGGERSSGKRCVDLKRTFRQLIANERKGMDEEDEKSGV
jgi:hypothetical protein